MIVAWLLTRPAHESRNETPVEITGVVINNADPEEPGQGRVFDFLCGPKKIKIPIRIVGVKTSSKRGRLQTVVESYQIWAWLGPESEPKWQKVIEHLPTTSSGGTTTLWQISLKDSRWWQGTEIIKLNKFTPGPPLPFSPENALRIPQNPLGMPQREFCTSLPAVVQDMITSVVQCPENS